jgi:hypothetical protein
MIMMIIIIDTLLMLGLLKTPGQLNGENQDISDSREETPVVLLTLPAILLCDFIYLQIKICVNFYNFKNIINSFYFE